MGQVARKSISQTFAELRQQGKLALMPFIAAGYPDLAATGALLEAIQRGGGSLVEIGFPFSDPIADGPTIQSAFAEALAKKLKLQDIFAAIAAVRPRLSIPLVGMVSYSIIFRHGTERFLAEAKAAGFDGLIVPDLPPPEAGAVCQKIRAADLDTVLLIAPATPPQRRQEIADLCSGFIYYLSVAGITGARQKLPQDIESNLRQIRQITGKPLCVGFGISRPEHLRQLSGLADGAIVGSALVRKVQEHAAEPAERIAAVAEEYCRNLLSLVR